MLNPHLVQFILYGQDLTFQFPDTGSILMPSNFCRFQLCHKLLTSRFKHLILCGQCVFLLCHIAGCKSATTPFDLRKLQLKLLYKFVAGLQHL
jgi:hypothetical protein